MIYFIYRKFIKRKKEAARIYFKGGFNIGVQII